MRTSSFLFPTSIPSRLLHLVGIVGYTLDHGCVLSKTYSRSLSIHARHHSCLYRIRKSRTQSIYFEAYKSRFLVLSNEASMHDVALIAKFTGFYTMDAKTSIFLIFRPLLGTP